MKVASTAEMWVGWWADWKVYWRVVKRVVKSVEQRAYLRVVHSAEMMVGQMAGK